MTRFRGLAQVRVADWSNFSQYVKQHYLSLVKWNWGVGCRWSKLYEVITWSYMCRLWSLYLTDGWSIYTTKSVCFDPWQISLSSLFSLHRYQLSLFEMNSGSLYSELRKHGIQCTSWKETGRGTPWDPKPPSYAPRPLPSWIASLLKDESPVVKGRPLPFASSMRASGVVSRRTWPSKYAIAQQYICEIYICKICITHSHYTWFEAVAIWAVWKTKEFLLEFLLAFYSTSRFFSFFLDSFSCF